jgi:hypothetical protein
MVKVEKQNAEDSSQDEKNGVSATDNGPLATSDLQQATC